MPVQAASIPARLVSHLSLFHLYEPQVLANPYPLYHRLRSEDPVHWDPFLHAWVVTRYKDVLNVLHHYSAERTPTPEQLTRMGLSSLNPIAQVMVKQMLFLDAPAHTRLRSLAAYAFTPARVEILRGHIRDITNQLLEKVQLQGRMDVIADLAEPLPCIVTAEMLGVPVKDHPQLKTWSQDFAEMLGNFQHNPDRAPQVLKSVSEMTAYFTAAIRDQRLRPRGGLVSSLMSAEIQGDRLTEEEVVANCIITMVGGQETTTNLIGNGVLTLLRNPNEMKKLREDLSLITSAVEEMLRYESPSQHTGRLAPEDQQLGGKLIRKQQAVMAVMGAANRDPERFPDPDRFDIGRKDNRHLAFGYAAHFCFGAALARVEGQEAFTAILHRFPDLELEPQPLVWRNNLGLRGLCSLPVKTEQHGVPQGEGPGSTRITDLSTAIAGERRLPNRDQLSENKRTLLRRCLNGQCRLESVGNALTVPRVSRNAGPLSLVQRQIWLTNPAADIPQFYNESITIHRKGALEPSLVEHCLLALIARHEAWRTTFDVLHGEPIQIIHPPPTSLIVPFVDLRAVPDNQRDAKASKLAATEVQRPFDLSRGPLFRAILMRLADDAYRLYLAVHQIIIDGVTAYHVLLPELVSLYQAFSENKPSPLPELPIQCVDFAYWQKDWPHNGMLDGQLAYWRKQLIGAPHVLRWPHDYPRPPRQTFRGQLQPFTLPRQLSDNIRRLSNSQGVTCFVTLLSGFVALLHYYTGQQDITVGTVSPAGRKKLETQGLMGYFLNPVPVRIKLSDNPSVRELLLAVQKVSAGALSNDDVPFQYIVEALKPAADPSRNPFFQVAASLEPSMPAVDPSWNLTPMDIESGGSRWDLYLVWDDRPNGFIGRVQFNPDLFSAATITKLLDDQEALLHEITLHPNSRLSALTHK